MRGDHFQVPFVGEQFHTVLRGHHIIALGLQIEQRKVPGLDFTAQFQVRADSRWLRSHPDDFQFIQGGDHRVHFRRFQVLGFFLQFFQFPGSGGIGAIQFEHIAHHDATAGFIHKVVLDRDCTQIGRVDLQQIRFDPFVEFRGKFQVELRDEGQFFIGFTYIIIPTLVFHFVADDQIEQYVVILRQRQPFATTTNLARIFRGGIDHAEPFEVEFRFARHHATPHRHQ